MRGLVEIVAVQQDYLEVVAWVCPGGGREGPLGYEDGYDFRVADALEAVAVAQHQPEVEAELFFLLFVGDALDLGDEGGVAFLLGQVEVGSCGRRTGVSGPRRLGLVQARFVYRHAHAGPARQ